MLQNYFFDIFWHRPCSTWCMKLTRGQNVSKPQNQQLNIPAPRWADSAPWIPTWLGLLQTLLWLARGHRVRQMASRCLFSTHFSWGFNLRPVSQNGSKMVGIHKENLQEHPLFGKIPWFSLQINALSAQGASWPNGWHFALRDCLWPRPGDGGLNGGFLAGGIPKSSIWTIQLLGFFHFRKPTNVSRCLVDVSSKPSHWSGAACSWLNLQCS